MRHDTMAAVVMRASGPVVRAVAHLRATRARRVTALLVCGGALIVFVRTYVPNQIYLPFYAYAVFAALFADTWESAIAICASAAIIALSFKDIRSASPRQAPRDIGLEVIFLLSALALVALVTRLRRVSVEAQQARAAVEAALRARDSSLATIAHDLKNPLLSIGLRGQVMRRRLVGEAPIARDEVDAAFAAIDRSVTTMTRLLDDVLALTRLHGGALPLVTRPTDLVALAGDQVRDYQQTTPRHHIRLDAVESTIVGVWDGNGLERVVANLLSNAIKYSPDGGDIVVVVRGDDGRGRATLEVRDTGIGIPVADRAHITERFHRAGDVGTITGVGLGLAGVRQIVEQHGGTLTITGGEPRGTITRIALPLSGPPSPTDVAAPPHP